MKIRGIIVSLIIFFVSSVIFAKEEPKKIKPYIKKEGTEKKTKQNINPAGAITENIKFEDISKVVQKETGKYLNQYKEILKEEVKPKGEFETEEEYKKRIEGVSNEMKRKKTQLIEQIYKRKQYYNIKEVPISLPQYNAEEQYFDIKLITLPILENVIYQPPEENTNLRYVPSENGLDLYLRLKIPPEAGKKIREKEKFIRGDFLFTIYLSLKSQEDLNVYSVVAFNEVELYIKENKSTSSIYKRSIRVNTPTFPKRDQ